MSETYKNATVRELGKRVQAEYAQKLINADETLAFTSDDLANGAATTSAADSLVIPVSSRYVAKTTGADAEALTLADGTFVGQRVNIRLITDGGGDGTLTPATPLGFATVVLADAGDFVDLEWTASGWVVIGAGGLTAQPTITA